MATSGVTDYSLPVDELINDASEMVGGEPILGGEAYFSAIRQLNLLLIELQNRGIPLFSLQRTSTVLRHDVAEYTLDSDTIDILELTSRTPTRISGTYSTDDADVTVLADNSFDNDLTTHTVFTIPNGSIICDAGTATRIVSVGFASGVSTTLTPIFEVSTDGTTWTTAYDVGQLNVTADQVYMYDLSTPGDYQYMRMRETGGAIMQMAEVFFVSANQDLQMQRISYDTYVTIPNKFTTGRPTQYYVERNASNTKLVVWPVPNIINYQVYYLRTRKLETVTAMAQEVEVPFRFLGLLTSGLAYKLGMRRPNLDPAKLAAVKAEYDNQFMWAMEEDRERSPTIITPRLRL